MDGVVARLQNQGSVCSDSNSEENCGVARAVTSSNNRRICLVGNLAKDSSLRSVAESFRVPVVTSKGGDEYAQDDGCDTTFVLESFEGDTFNRLCKQKETILGAVALRQLAAKKEALPYNIKPLFNLSMVGVVVTFSGFRTKTELSKLVPLVHHMGASIRKNVSEKVTHLISNAVGGERYQYATTFRVPAMDAGWVYASWEKRNDLDFNAAQDSFVAKHKLKPFHGARVAFVGFSEDEERHMSDVLLSNGGTVSSLEDPACSHVVVERGDVYTLEAASAPLSPAPTSCSSPPPPSVCPDDLYSSRYPLDTVHEKSHDAENKRNEHILSELDRSSVGPDSPVGGRKRKLAHLDQSKKCASEKKRKVSGIFKTPLSYFSSRRRTIDASSLNNQSLNESVISSSGIFNVEDLSINDSFSGSNTPKIKHSRMNLFARTFSSSKFGRGNKSCKKRDLNCTRLSFGDKSEVDGDKLNASFPAISFLNPVTHSELRCQYTEDAHGPTVPVVDESNASERPKFTSPKVHIVKAAWFWTSVQKEVCLDETDYLYGENSEPGQSTPGGRRDSQQATPSSASRRKRKRVHEAVLAWNRQQSSPGLHNKRRSSLASDVSGSFLDCTASPDKVLDGPDAAVIDTPRKGLTPRQLVFLELLQTESNYVDILSTIMTMFKKHLEEMPDDEALLNSTEVNIIFGKLPPIYDTHVKMLAEMREFSKQWSEEHSIGSIIVKYSEELRKAYPPYINYFEEMKDMLVKCDQSKPRFHAFLKVCQTKAECGRQSLQELIIRPVQRLGSICLLLDSILKQTPKTNPDHEKVELALAALKKVMALINEDKRKAEAQITLFNIFNEIDNCPPDIVSSHRHFLGKAEVIQVSTMEGLSSKGSCLVLFLFSDTVAVCKKKSKSFNNGKSPSGSLQRPLTKPYKHLKLMPLNTIKRVVDIKETDECQKVFCFICRNNTDDKEKVFSFAMADVDADKGGFLKTLTKQMANNACTPDSDKFLAYLEPDQLDIDMSDVNGGTLSKAFKFATRTRLKVGRAFSFNKTPSKLKRAVSSMISPFGSSSSLTPSSELAQMRLASYNNISELGRAENATLPLAPMSVQPTRKVKSSSMNEMKRI